VIYIYVYALLFDEEKNDNRSWKWYIIWHITHNQLGGHVITFIFKKLKQKIQNTAKSWLLGVKYQNKTEIIQTNENV